MTVGARELWQPDRNEQIAASEHLLCMGILHHEARAVTRQKLADWLDHAKGNRRRAHEYKRWALEYEADGNLPKYRHYRQQSDRSWRAAKDAVANAKIQREILWL